MMIIKSWKKVLSILHYAQKPHTFITATRDTKKTNDLKNLIRMEATCHSAHFYAFHLSVGHFYNSDKATIVWKSGKNEEINTYV